MSLIKTNIEINKNDWIFDADKQKFTSDKFETDIEMLKGGIQTKIIRDGRQDTRTFYHLETAMKDIAFYESAQRVNQFLIYQDSYEYNRWYFSDWDNKYYIKTGQFIFSTNSGSYTSVYIYYSEDFTDRGNHEYYWTRNKEGTIEGALKIMNQIDAVKIKLKTAEVTPTSKST